MEGAEVKAELMRIKGIGPWTADIYLLMALRRPDIWPSHDLARAAAMQEVKGLSSLSTPAELDALAASWSPWRTVAARVLWHLYLSKGV
jgi:DNA-3-methyladenine glycosylase II